MCRVAGSFLYNDYIMRETKRQPCIAIGGHTINNLHYADEIKLTATTQKDHYHILDITNKKSRSSWVET